VTTGELRLLRIFGSELVTDAVEELHVALLRLFLECRDEGPRHGSGSLRRDGGVGPVCDALVVSDMTPPGSNKWLSRRGTEGKARRKR